MNGYELSRQWFDFAFENPDKVSANHTALYLFLCEINNRLGWVNRFQITSKECMSGMGCKSYNTYKKIFDDLVEFQFVIILKKSANQYQCNIIALSKIDTALYKALNKAPHKALYKALDEAIDKALATFINKEQATTEPLNKEPTGVLFEIFWNLYDKKVGAKEKCEKKWNKLLLEEQEKIMESLPTFLKQFSDKQFQPFPETYLNQKRWNDELKNGTALPQKGIDKTKPDPEIYTDMKLYKIDFDKWKATLT